MVSIAFISFISTF